MTRRLRKAAKKCGLFFLALPVAAGSAQAACDFRPPLANEVPLGTIAPTQVGSVVSSITLRFRCGRGDTPAFSVTGSNDTGPGLHRMRNLTRPTEYLPYRAATSLPNRTRLLITITVTEGDYRDAWVGPYEDTLFVIITP
jgi:hypothetical protein